MPSSDSEDFESADEGHTHLEKKERKKRLSSSNYSDTALESDIEPKDSPKKQGTSEKPIVTLQEKTDGWDDFDIDNPIEDKNPKITGKPRENLNEPKSKEPAKSQDTGWDDFDDWDEDVQKEPQSKLPVVQPNTTTVEAPQRCPAAPNKNNSWGWGWGESLLNTATAGITTLTSQVSQGISTVLETGIGAPDPEELAKKNIKDNDAGDRKSSSSNDNKPASATETDNMDQTSAGEGAFQLGSLLSGVTKFVETTGTKVLAGGLDTLETIGKKTMEVLQDGDPGLAKKRAMLGLDAGDKPVLSQVLREAKTRAEEEDRIREEKREAKEVHYENLFDDFEGLVHLEALEMLSRQVSMRIEDRMRGLDTDKRQELRETLQQVAELCEMSEEEDDDEETSEDMSKSEAFHERLQTSTQDLSLKLQFQPLVKQYTEVLDWLSSEEVTEKAIYKRAVSGLAQATALSVEVYHKSAEMLLVKARRSTADEADALTQMTVVLTKHVSELATLFTEKLNSITSDNKEQVNNYITNIFLEAGNSSTYIQNAFQLALPILQIGAV